jgi:hypothetical protein
MIDLQRAYPDCLDCGGVARDGPRLPRIQEQYKKAPESKALIILEGSAHAQYLFQTDQAERALHVILKFLSAQ